MTNLRVSEQKFKLQCILPAAIFHAAIFQWVLRTNFGNVETHTPKNACTAALSTTLCAELWCATWWWWWWWRRRIYAGSMWWLCVWVYINILFRELIHLATQYFISDNYLAPSTPLSSSCISQRNEWPRNYTQNRLPPLAAHQNK